MHRNASCWSWTDMLKLARYIMNYKFGSTNPSAMYTCVRLVVLHFAHFVDRPVLSSDGFIADHMYYAEICTEKCIAIRCSMIACLSWDKLKPHHFWMRILPKNDQTLRMDDGRDMWNTQMLKVQMTLKTFEMYRIHPSKRKISTLRAKYEKHHPLNPRLMIRDENWKKKWNHRLVIR